MKTILILFLIITSIVFLRIETRPKYLIGNQEVMNTEGSTDTFASSSMCEDHFYKGAESHKWKDGNYYASCTGW